MSTRQYFQGVIQKIYLWFRDFTIDRNDRGEASAGYWQAKVRECAVKICRSCDGRLLDVGCDEGLFLSGLAKINPCSSLFGADNRLEILSRAKEILAKSNVKAASLTVSEAARLPFRDACFDLVVCVNVFYNVRGLSDIRDMVYEMGRVLKPKGVLVIEFRNSLNPFLRLKYKLAKYYDATLKNKYLNTYNLRDIETILRKCNLKVRRNHYLEFPVKALAPIIMAEVVKE